MGEWYTEEGEPRVPASQHKTMLGEIQKRMEEATGRYRRAVTYKDRRDAEDDIAGLQALHARVQGWKVYENRKA